MRVYLAGLATQDEVQYAPNRYILDSFFYMKERQMPSFLQAKDLLVDSGAFTFLNSNIVNLDLTDYIDKYIKFINNFKIRHYFELDVDSVKNLKYVETVRRELENQTGVKPIPVWHKSRGVNYFKDMCEEYKYVAIGGIVTKEIKPKEYSKLIPLVNYAHKKGVKVHGLGFTRFKDLKRIHFDSVDSSSWSSGARFGKAYQFNSHTGVMGTLDLPEDKKLKWSSLNRHNIREWTKFQNWAENNL